MKQQSIETVEMQMLVGGGQTLGLLPDGKKIFVWGALPGERALVQLTKNKSSYAEGIATEILVASPERVAPHDPESYLSTSPWQILDFANEQTYKAQLIEEAFQLHQVILPAKPEVYTDNRAYHYRNKVEFSWWWDTDRSRLELAFFRRGGHGKVPVEATSLARPEINKLAQTLRDLLRTKPVEARSLKTLLIRCTQSGECVWQLYTKDKLPELITDGEATTLPAAGGEIIYSDPRSPASRITERLKKFGDTQLRDSILGASFQYAAESFFQVNLPVYEQALRDMREWLHPGKVIDLYSGIGSIGLTISQEQLTLVESDAAAFREMEQNIAALGRQVSAQPVLASSEQSLKYITSETTIIVDPPRAGLHPAVVERLLKVQPARILYLSCNPVTQARDVGLLLAKYQFRHCQGYNFFPCTPHIEHFVVLEKKQPL